MDRLLVTDFCEEIEPACKKNDTRYLKLQWKKLNNFANRIGGSRDIFCELFGDQLADNTFWLDSSSTDQRRSRFSFMGGKGGSLWKQVTYRLSNQSSGHKCGGHLSITDTSGEVRTLYLKDGLLNFLEAELQSFHYKKEDYEALPFDFCGGYVGYIGYNLKVECGMEKNRHKSKTPDACLFFADNLVVVDHFNDDVYILSVHEAFTSGYSITEGQRNSSYSTSWLTKIEQKLLAMKVVSNKTSETKLKSSISILSKDDFQVDKSRDKYIEDVKKCLKLIKDGESYELCLTTQMRKNIEDIDSLSLYLSLREKNPAPYASWLNFSKEDLCICCSSPERFLRLDRNGFLEAKPIKGTICRGDSPEQDDHFRLKLKYSQKDQAENLMIVDLLRNDLGRVCDPGSVHVPRLMEIETYATVHTMVSTIRGKKKSKLSPIDCIRAAFPGGSMTGAPKLRSMELLDSIEDNARGIYSGSIGFFSYNQTFDLNIVIRTLVIHDHEASVGAGGAIVALSKPEDEYEEMMLKAKAPTQAILQFQSQFYEQKFSSSI